MCKMGKFKRTHFHWVACNKAPAKKPIPVIQPDVTIGGYRAFRNKDGKIIHERFDDGIRIEYDHAVGGGLLGARIAMVCHDYKFGRKEGTK